MRHVWLTLMLVGEHNQGWRQVPPPKEAHHLRLDVTVGRLQRKRERISISFSATVCATTTTTILPPCNPPPPPPPPLLLLLHRQRHDDDDLGAHYAGLAQIHADSSVLLEQRASKWRGRTNKRESKDRANAFDLFAVINSSRDTNARSWGSLGVLLLRPRCRETDCARDRE